MTRAVDPAVITELAKDNFNLCHLVYLQISGGLYLTDYGHDIIYAGRTYVASNNLLSLASPQETQELRVGQININVSGVDQSFISIFLNQNWINRDASISMAVISDAGAVIGAPVVTFSGQMTQFEISEDDKNSDVTIAIASHWADFKRTAGRMTNSSSQQYFFPNDLGFEYSANTVKDLKWGRK